MDGSLLLPNGSVVRETKMNNMFEGPSVIVATIEIPYSDAVMSKLVRTYMVLPHHQQVETKPADDGDVELPEGAQPAESAQSEAPVEEAKPKRGRRPKSAQSEAPAEEAKPKRGRRPKSAQSEAPAEEAAPEVTLADLGKAMARAAEIIGVEGARAALAAFGADKINELQEGDRRVFLLTLDKMVENEGSS